MVPTKKLIIWVQVLAAVSASWLAKRSFLLPCHNQPPSDGSLWEPPVLNCILSTVNWDELFLCQEAPLRYFRVTKSGLIHTVMCSSVISRELLGWIWELAHMIMWAEKPDKMLSSSWRARRAGWSPRTQELGKFISEGWRRMIYPKEDGFFFYLHSSLYELHWWS